MGCGKAVSLSAGQGVLRRWTEGKVWQGRAYLGSGPRYGPAEFLLRCFSSQCLSFLPLPFSTGGSLGGADAE